MKDRWFVDLFCGPGRVTESGSGVFQDGGALLALQAAANGPAPFTGAVLSDGRPEFSSLAQKRASARGHNCIAEAGFAHKIAPRIAEMLPPKGLHLAFLDPYGIEAIPFSTISALAKSPRIDILIHFSLMDFRRNFTRLTEDGKMDEIVPDWRSSVSPQMGLTARRQAVFDLWIERLRSLRFLVRSTMPHFRGDKNQDLYVLVLASRHKLADEFWRKACDTGRQRELQLN